MTDTPTAAAIVVGAPARASWKDMIPALALLLTIVGLIFAGGQLFRQIGDNERRIVQLELRVDRGDSETRDLGKQLAAVNAKLDLLIERTPARP